MKHKLTLHYSITNCGDGSAAMTLMESLKLAHFDQENQCEGWGEDCTGSINLESDSPITVNEYVETKESYLINLIDGENENLDDFIEEFFPDGIPEFTVKIDETMKDKTYVNNLILIGDRQVGSIFAHRKDSGEVLEQKLRALRK